MILSIWYTDGTWDTIPINSSPEELEDVIEKRVIKIVTKRKKK